MLLGGNRIKIFGLLALTLIVGGCSTLKTRMSGTGPGVSPPAILAILPAEEDAPAHNAAAMAALTAALVASGYTVTEDGGYVIDFSVSDRPASLSIATSTSAPPAKHGIFRACKDQIHRMTLTIADRKTGQSRYQGFAEERHCHGTLADSITPLANALAADIKQPVGARIIPRAGRD